MIGLDQKYVHVLLPFEAHSVFVALVFTFRCICIRLRPHDAIFMHFDTVSRDFLKLKHV